MKVFTTLPKRFSRKGVTYVKSKMSEKNVLATGRKFRRVTSKTNPNKVVFYLVENYSPSRFIEKHENEFESLSKFRSETRATVRELKKYPEQNKTQIQFFKSVLAILNSRLKTKK